MKAHLEQFLEGSANNGIFLETLNNKLKGLVIQVQ